nr:methyltransferase domain-containing protein [uncultured Olsenella sp.]
METRCASPPPDRPVVRARGQRPQGSVLLARGGFVVGDCKRTPLDAESFDVVICSMSFHHYPSPQGFFDSAFRVLHPGGELVLNDSTGNALPLCVTNHIELPLANLTHKSDVRIYSRKGLESMCSKAGLGIETFVNDKVWHLCMVARKPR